ncbi:MAG TPA: C_GCAxxG_C_C family protein [Clostridiales bacterium]|jgi:C_GCAxxG_C_C family probable redox protein|nr:C_GCAxxG_C_C family protein [Clostridiales bacterium]
MKNRTQRTQEIFDNGYNCAQAVFGAFCEELGMDFETGMRLMSSFGGGIGGLHEVCGAVSGMAAAAGLAFASSAPSDTSAKERHYELIREMAGKFKDRNGFLICRELLAPLGENPEPEERHRHCLSFVKCAAEILENELRSAEKDDA